jgi:hypothetical protein
MVPAIAAIMMIKKTSLGQLSIEGPGPVWRPPAMRSFRVITSFGSAGILSRAGLKRTMPQRKASEARASGAY